MKKIGGFTALCMILLCVLIAADHTSAQIQLPTGHVRTIESKIVEGMTYHLYIDLPPGYETSDQSYPVVYLLDAYEVWGLVLQTYQQLIFLNDIPEMIIVGISYPIEGDFYTEGLREHLDIRARDFTPTQLTYEEAVKKHGKGTAQFIRVSGGGKAFLGFVEKELIPFIEKEYRADPENRGLFGYSLGGTFTTFAMLYKPGLFRNYFIGSPFLNWDDKAVYTFDRLDHLAESGDTVNVYLSFGELESSDGHHHPLKNYLEEKANTHIHFLSEVLPGENHLSGVGLAHSRAFRSLYGRKK